MRVVYDASSTVFGPSLNDCLHIGPPLNPLLFDTLLRFRVHEVALTADIEKALLNIEIDPEHRDFVRFLKIRIRKVQRSWYYVLHVWCLV